MSEIPTDPEELDAYVRERAEKYTPGDEAGINVEGGCYDVSIANRQDCENWGGQWQSNACFFPGRDDCG